jgi:hypothetical protein
MHEEGREKAVKGIKRLSDALRAACEQTGSANAIRY